MKKIVLVCNAGMSTGILAQKIQKASNQTMKVEAYGESEYLEHLENVDLILIGPQLRFLLPQIRHSTPIRVEPISPVKYGIMDGKGVYEDILSIIGGK